MIIKKKIKVASLNRLNDFVIKKIIGTKGQEGALEGFINAVLAHHGEPPIKDPVILNDVTLTRENINDKLGILDILAKTADGKHLVNIEIQLENTDDIITRSGFYHSRIKTGKDAIQAGKDYASMPKVLSINLLNYIDGRFHADEYHTRIINVDANHRELIFDFSENHFIELPKFRKQTDHDLNNPLHRWLLYLDSKTNPQLKEEIIAMDNSIQVAENAAQRIAATPEEMELYRLREKYEMDKLSSEIYLMERGRKLQKEAFRLLKALVPAEEIKETLQITDEELASYRADFDELFS